MENQEKLKEQLKTHLTELDSLISELEDLVEEENQESSDPDLSITEESLVDKFPEFSHDERSPFAAVGLTDANTPYAVFNTLQKIENECGGKKSQIVETLIKNGDSRTLRFMLLVAIDATSK